MNRKSRDTICLAFGSLSAFLSGNAWATPMQLILTATDITNPAVFSTTFSDVTFGTDTVTPQSSPNVISIPSGIQGDIRFSGEMSISTIGGLLNSLITSALTVTNTSTTDTYRLTAALSGMNFVGPANKVSVTGSGTWQTSPGSIMHLAFYDDPANVLGASTPTDHPGNLVGAFVSDPADVITSSFSYSPGTHGVSPPDLGLFSMTETWDYTLAPGGSLVSRGQTESKTFDAPEPSSMLLLGLGLVGIGVRRRGRRISGH